MLEYLLHFLKIYAASSLRYMLFAGVTFLIFYVWKKRAFLHYKIQQRYPAQHQIVTEAGNSFLSMSIFALMGVVVYWLNKHNYTKIYLDFSQHSVGYFLFSVVVFIVLHDAYFYWTHRLMHWEKIYKYIHRTHHLSTNPTPWAAFAFHPIEAVIEVGILPIMVFLIPLHPFAILAWIVYMTALNVMGHLGFELFPKGFTKNKWVSWHNTSVHHNMHHRLVRCNYSLYFNVWDKLFGTNHEMYHEEFERVVEQRYSSTPHTNAGLEVTIDSSAG